jgi:hypothetical protein
MINRIQYCAVVLVFAATPYAQAQQGTCDRACLNGIVDQYLAALPAHNPEMLPHTADIKFTENNVVLQLGDGLWATADKVRDYKIYFDDPAEGSVGVYTVVEEDGNPAIVGARFKVLDRKVTELETIVARKNRPAETFPNADALVDKPIYHEDVPASESSSREKMIEIANSYFETLQQNDGTIKAPFDPNCNRVENGVQTTNNSSRPGDSGNAGPSLGCEAQFKTGNFHFVTHIRDRRFPVVDEQKGLVLVSTFFDHAGNMRSVALTNGKTAKIGLPFDRPYSFVICSSSKFKTAKSVRSRQLFRTCPTRCPPSGITTQISELRPF